MLTVLDAINKSTEYFTKKDIESPRTNAELLLADILQCKRLDLYLMFDRPLDKDQVDKYREYISRRGKKEPVQYIIGKVEFFGLEFYVNRDVLIPRQETEILVETIIKNHEEDENLRILDIGTGSGNIPVCLAKNLSIQKVVGVDKSEKSLKTAAMNVKVNQLENKIQLLETDIFRDDTIAEGSEEYDIIVSNPPYVSKDEYGQLRNEIVDYEPDIAVTDLSDGYSFYRRITEIAVPALKHNGIIYFEVGQGQSAEVLKILDGSGFRNIRVVKDYLDIERVVYGEKL